MVVITEIRKLEFILDFVLGSKFNMDFTEYTTIYKIIKTKGTYNHNCVTLELSLPRRVWLAAIHFNGQPSSMRSQLTTPASWYCVLPNLARPAF